MATVFAVPWARIEPWPDALTELHRAGFRTLAMTPADDSLTLADVNRTERLAIMVGTEGMGLTPAALAHCDLRVRIPMRPGVDSLNVSAATAIAFYALGNP